MKVTTLISATSVIVLPLAVLHLANAPPKEGALIANFEAHRAAYEQLKVYLEADDQVDAVGSWGIEPRGSLMRVIPPQEGFSRARFDEYLVLLNEVHGSAVHRARGRHPELCVGMWGRGFAGSTDHINVCWLYQTMPGKPALSIDNIDWAADHSVGQRQYFYRKIEGNWYLERDG